MHRRIQHLGAWIGFFISSSVIAQEKPLLQEEWRGEVFAEAAMPVQAAPLHPFATRTRIVRPQVDALRASVTGSTMQLTLFPNTVLAGVVTRVEWRGPQSFSIFGQVPDVVGGSFIFTVEEDAVASVIRLPGRSQLYELRYLAEGIYAISEIDESRFPPCAERVPAPMVPAAPPVEGAHQEDILAPFDELVRRAMAPSGEGQDGGEPESCIAPGPVLDLLVVYTPAARIQAGGVNFIRAECQLMIDVTNQAYLNSAIGWIRVRMVNSLEVDYTESGSALTDLNRLAVNNDGFMDIVHTWRATYRADAVGLIVETLDFCGRGYCTPAIEHEAFFVVRRDCAVTNFTFAHELGHNLGCDHDRTNAGNCGDVGYQHGLRFTGVSGANYRTVMAYDADPGFPRIDYFSNPNVFVDGSPTGIPIGQPLAAHNTQVIINNSPTIEGYRATLMDMWVQFGAIFGNGTFNAPYGLISQGVNALLTDSAGASELPTLWIKSGTTNQTITIDKRLQIRPCGGTVIIGQQ